MFITKTKHMGSHYGSNIYFPWILKKKSHARGGKNKLLRCDNIFYLSSLLQTSFIYYSIVSTTYK